MTRFFLLTAITVILSGCAASLRVDKLQSFTPQSKTFVLLGSSQYDSALRIALAKNGFKILRFASQNRVISEGGEGEIARVFDESGASYGLTFSWEQVDRCLYNSSKLIDGTLEVTDIRSNEVLLIIEKGGWTGSCLDPRGQVFEGLAQALSDNWVEQH